MKSSAPTSTGFCLSAEACFILLVRSFEFEVYIWEEGKEKGDKEEIYLINSNRLPVQPYLVHDPRSVLCIFLTDELHEAIALMRLRYSVFG
jgi:hypothetical protein